MTSGEKVALSLLAEICKLKADNAEATADAWRSNAEEGCETDNPEYQYGFFRGVEIATRSFEKRLKELTGDD